MFKKIFLGLFILVCSTLVAQAQTSQPCQWNYSFVDGVSNATYCGNIPQVGVTLATFGCIDDGVMDCGPSIKAAVAWAAQNNAAIVWPKGVVRSSLAINFGAVPVRGSIPVTATYPPIGGRLQCDDTVTGACATFGVSGATKQGGSVQDLIIDYAPGTPPSASSLFVFQGNNSRCNNLMAYNGYDAFTWKNGISAHCSNLFTFDISDRHFVVNSFAELYINQARAGLNGAPDPVSSVSFLGITGNDPNTIYFSNSQFNLSSQSPAHLIDYYSLGTQINGNIQISQSTVDMSVGSCASIIHTDASAFVNRLSITASHINAPTCPLIDQSVQLHSPADLTITNNNLLAVSTISIDTGSVSGPSFDISHNDNISGNVALNSGSLSHGIGKFNANHVSGSLTITSGGSWHELDEFANDITGAYTDTATGLVKGNPPPITFTPVMSFGATNATATAASGLAYRQPDGSVKFEFGIVLSNLNGGTGAALISGLPFTCAANDKLPGGYNSPQVVPFQPVNLLSLTGAPLIYANQATATLVLAENSATGLSALTNANFKVGSLISASVPCFPQ